MLFSHYEINPLYTLSTYSNYQYRQATWYHSLIWHTPSLASELSARDLIYLLMCLVSYWNLYFNYISLFIQASLFRFPTRSFNRLIQIPIFFGFSVLDLLAFIYYWKDPLNYQLLIFFRLLWQDFQDVFTKAFLITSHVKSAVSKVYIIMRNRTVNIETRILNSSVYPIYRSIA